MEAGREKVMWQPKVETVDKGHLGHFFMEFSCAFWVHSGLIVYVTCV